MTTAGPSSDTADGTGLNPTHRGSWRSASLFAVLISGQLAASDATLVLSITSAGRTTASAKPPVEVVDLSRGGIALLMP